MSVCRVLGVSLETQEGDIAANVARATSLVRDHARDHEVDLVVLPELFTCGYCSMDLSSYGEDADSETFRTFASLAEDLDAVIGWGFAEKATGHLVYNSFALLEPGRAPVVVRKTHLHLSEPGSQANEPEFLLPGGQLGLVVTSLGTFGVMICYDGCFVEVARSLVLQGADCILWPSRSDRYIPKTGFPRIRAIDNIAPVIYVEGGQTGRHFPLRSHSQIVDHRGNVLSGSEGEGLLQATLNVGEARDFRQTSLGASAQYRVRRPELYRSITELRDDTAGGVGGCPLG